MDISTDIQSNQIVLLVLSKTRYMDDLPSIVKAALPAQGMMCYVTINRPYLSILQSIKSEGIEGDRFLFIDAITSTVHAPTPSSNCIFVPAPDALTDLGLALSDALSRCDLVLFDTLSTLVIYQDIGSVLKFIHNLVTKLRIADKKGVLIALREDSAELIKDLHMFVDKVVEMPS